MASPSIASSRRLSTAERFQAPESATPSSSVPVNVGDNERVASAFGGGALALYGLARGSLSGLGLAALGGALVYRGWTGRCSCYQALGVSTAEPTGTRTSVRAGAGVRVEKVLTINRPREELYRFWRNFEQLPRCMRHLVRVVVNGNRSHWAARGPMDKTVEWDAEIITDRPNEVIAWRSLPGSDVDTAGSVHFQPAPGGRGTEVRVELKYDPPFGRAGAGIAWLFGKSADQEIQEDLRRFKQLMEAGEIATTRGQSSGRS